MTLERFPQKNPIPFSALAFDFGTNRIGVAIGQSITGTAQPLRVLKARDGIPDWAAIADLITQWQPALLVVGIPANLDDSRSDLTSRAEKFANRLNGRFHLPCYGIDERLTSVAAAERLRLQGGRAELDSVAAQIILESWFSELARQFPAA